MIKIIWVGSPKLFTVLFGYSTDGSGIKIIWVCSQKIINGSLWLFTEGFGIKIIVFGYQELTYWFAAVLAENWCLVSSLISSFTDSWCFFLQNLGLFLDFFAKKGWFHWKGRRSHNFFKVTTILRLPDLRNPFLTFLIFPRFFSSDLGLSKGTWNNREGSQVLSLVRTSSATR